MNKQQQKLLSYSYDLLAKRRYTIKQMIIKLDARNIKSLAPVSPDELQQIIEHLIKSSFLNDRQYAEFYIEGQIRKKPVGPLKLKQQLQLKGIPKDLIEQVLNTADLNEVQLAKNALVRKLGLNKPNFNAIDGESSTKSKFTLSEKQKLFRYLQSSGFNSSSIFKALNFSPED